MTTTEDRVLGAFFGGAVGDAFGYPIEFLSLGEIQERHGPTGLEEPVLTDGELVVSDDTQMTLFTAEGIVAAFREDPEPDTELVTQHVFEAYQRWAITQGVGLLDIDASWGLAADPRLQVRRAPGTTCLSALTSGVPGSPDEAINESKGCGGVMRVAPLGLVSAWGPEEVFDLGSRSAALTHGHPSGQLAAGAFACIVRVVFEGDSVDDGVAHSFELLRSCVNAEETIAALEASMRVDSIDALGEGWVAEEAFAIAVFCARQSTTFAEAVRLAANHSGDSDSTASLTGQLVGAAQGVDAIDRRWMDPLDVIEALDRVAGCFSDLPAE